MSYTTSIRRVAAVMPKEFLPQKVNGRWRKPKISPRRQAVLRKQALLQGKPWPWERERLPLQPVVRKGVQKSETRRQNRQKLIQEKMAEMPEMELRYYKQLQHNRNRESFPVVAWTEEVPRGFSPRQYNPRAQITKYERLLAAREAAGIVTQEEAQKEKKSKKKKKKQQED